MSPLIIKKYENKTEIAQMYQSKFDADKNIADDFTEILDKIIIDIYLKTNIFSSNEYINLSNEEKKQFVLKKREEILEKMIQNEFTLLEYINSKESSFKMTACVKCNCLGIYDKDYDDWKRNNPGGLYCEVCKQEQDDFKNLL